MLGGFGGYIIYILILMAIPLWAQSKVKKTYKIYSKKPTSSLLTGREVALKILQDNGIYDVDVVEVRGTLSDHYDPSKKKVCLSSENFHGQTMASSAIAAHEVGHAIQDAQSYAFLRFRHSLFPLANLGDKMSFIIIIIGAITGLMNLVLVGVVFMAFAVLFQLVTLPVEFDASSRAMDQLVATGIIRTDEERETKKVLSAAALTYVAAAFVAVAELMRFVLMFLGNDD